MKRKSNCEIMAHNMGLKVKRGDTFYKCNFLMFFDFLTC